MFPRMVQLHIANYTEHIDASIKIMAVQTGINNIIHFRRETLDEMFSLIKRQAYETGGIIGVDDGGIISAFQFDKTCNSSPFEYCPNVDFLDRVINKKWAKRNIEFVGFVHSHLNNCEISQQDIEYARNILEENSCLESILIGVINLGENKNHMEIYFVNMKEISKICYTIM